MFAKTSFVLLGALGLSVLLGACSDDSGPADTGMPADTGTPPDTGMADADGPDGGGDPSWRIVASAGMMVGEYGDNFVYDGSNLRPGEGTVVIDVDPVTDTGRMEATWVGTHSPRESTVHTGEIRIVVETWMAMIAREEGGVVEDVTLHGDTGFGPPVMPTVHAFLAGWGPVQVYVDGSLEYEVHGHFMYTEGAREPDGLIYKSDRATPYDPETPADSWVDPDDRELHVVAHSSDPDRLNYPMHTIWFHLNFEEPTVERAPAGAVR